MVPFPMILSDPYLRLQGYYRCPRPWTSLYRINRGVDASTYCVHSCRAICLR